MHNLYWINTYDGHEDWFVISKDVYIAECFFASKQGYDLELVEAEDLGEINSFGIEDESFFPSLELLEKNGFEIISENTPITVWRNGRKYREGNILQKVILEVSNGKKGVYILSVNDSDLYKIGVTKNIIGRIKQLNTGNPFEFSIYDFYVTENHHNLESILHDKLKERKFRGEWFLLTKEEVKEVAKFAREFIGKPNLPFVSLLQNIKMDQFKLPESFDSDTELPF